MDLSYKAEERDRKTHGRTGDRKFSIKFSYNLLEGDSWSNSGGIILGMFPALVVFKHHLAILGVARNADLYPRFDSDDFFNLSPVLLQGRYCCVIGVGSAPLASLASFGYSYEFAGFWV
ncbi:hypothetical protein OIU74_025875 [Salix koriyanagi]|uniref:Uncharacterized protein n=1 Tax=Salix koriyanagi TaxID=2511006 RepID=A0A9Q0W296_9ROSI|nr:hypothetical protein OIU74_025875 [Salix koriyanagi]